MKNAIIQTLENRIASRDISSEKFDDAIIAELIEAARLTPSCYNKQPWRFIFCESEEALAKGRAILSQGNQEWASNAPLLIIAYSRRANDCVLGDGRIYHQFDLGMAVMNIMLAATRRGLTARPMAGFSPDGARDTFGLDDADEALVMIAVGKPSDGDGSEQPRERVDADKIAKRI